MSGTLTEQIRHSQPRMDGVPEVSGDGAAGADFHAHLQRFVVAKSQIINIYQEMSAYVLDVNRYQTFGLGSGSCYNNLPLCDSYDSLLPLNVIILVLQVQTK